MNFLFRQDVGYEAGFVRQPGPEWLWDRDMSREPAEIVAKLPQCRGVRRHANGLAPGLAGQPSKNRLIEMPAWVFSCVVPEKPIELLQREFLPCISIAQAPLEVEKTLEFACHRAMERAVIEAP